MRVTECSSSRQTMGVSLSPDAVLERRMISASHLRERTTLRVGSPVDLILVVDQKAGAAKKGTAVSLRPSNVRGSRLSNQRFRPIKRVIANEAACVDFNTGRCLKRVRTQPERDQ